MNLQETLSSLPNSPGVYQFLNALGKVIYVGKAKDLRKRVISYFSNKHVSGKTAIMVKKIADIQVIMVSSESEALLLENTLIKKIKPRYNVLLKDDKTYPWICIKSEAFPRVIKTRRYIQDKSLYFGPYTSGRALRIVMDFFKTHYALRTCIHNLSKSNIEKGRFKVCLEYHIGNCKAPCVGLITEGEYQRYIDEIKQILKSNIKSIIEKLKQKMLDFASQLEFEKANETKENVLLLERIQAKSQVVNPELHNIDVFCYNQEKNRVYISFMRIINGSVSHLHTIELINRIEETKEDILAFAIVEIRNLFGDHSKEIIIPFDIEFDIPNAKFMVPKRGEKLQLLEMAERNLRYYKLQSLLKTKNNEEFGKKGISVLEKLQVELRLKQLPNHIECFDNSNLMGTNPVSSCVVFKKGRPLKREYRHYNIKTVEGIDDFASMKEVVRRRYTRLLNENLPLPQLIIVDGGKGQLSAAVEILEELNLYGSIAIIGIAKRLEEIYFPSDSVPLYLEKMSSSMRLIQKIRNEAHRFGINFHRLKRGKSLIRSELDQVKGLGEKSVAALYNKFSSIENIRKYSLSELEEIIGKKRSKILIDYFKNTQDKL